MNINSEELIIELNYQKKIIDERREPGAFDSKIMFELLPETIVDKRSLQLLEIHDLFKALDHTVTSVGAARLFHSLMNPSESIELIHAKHDSFCELESNDRLQNAIGDFLTAFQHGEQAIFRLLNAHILAIAPYSAYRQAMQAINDLMRSAENLPQPETVYLDSLIKSILSFTGSQVYSLARGPVYRTMSGVCSRREKGFFTPALKFRPSRLSPGSIAPALPGMYFGLGWLTGFLDVSVAKAMFFLTGGISTLGIIYGAVLKPIFDYETAILPVRKRLLNSNSFVSAMEAVAAIDELLSFILYCKNIPHPTVIPEITNKETHCFTASDLRNPILAKADKNFVANDVVLDGCRVTFVTGPNSGGKTTYCKTIAQNQILGQIGAPVVASQAKMNMTDKLTYQAPTFDTLNDPEGRFGTELKVTRDIFYAVTPKSLTFLDEIAEGTTTREKMTLSVDIMNGFYVIGNNTILVTHSHELAGTFRQQNRGQYLQVGFDDHLPTHRMIEGVSADSHADRVAQKIGFSREDIQFYLKEKGYAEPGVEAKE